MQSQRARRRSAVPLRRVDAHVDARVDARVYVERLGCGLVLVVGDGRHVIDILMNPTIVDTLTEYE